jgi:hypothetical protein
MTNRLKLNNKLFFYFSGLRFCQKFRRLYRSNFIGARFVRLRGLRPIPDALRVPPPRPTCRSRVVPSRTPKGLRSFGGAGLRGRAGGHSKDRAQSGRDDSPAHGDGKLPGKR